MTQRLWASNRVRGAIDVNGVASNTLQGWTLRCAPNFVRRDCRRGGRAWFGRQLLLGCS